jgi:general secretion pathway protein G
MILVKNKQYKQSLSLRGRTKNKGFTLISKACERGFTLIELLVVISIIGILATLMISRYGMAEKSARDAERKSDLNQYRIALENYASQTGGVYPSRPNEGDASSGVPCTSLSPNYMSICPQDPRQEVGETTYQYSYDTNGTAGEIDATDYILWARMETGSGFWYLCSDGRASEKTSQPASTDCF